MNNLDKIKLVIEYLYSKDSSFSFIEEKGIDKNVFFKWVFKYKKENDIDILETNPSIILIKPNMIDSLLLMFVMLIFSGIFLFTGVKEFFGEGRLGIVIVMIILAIVVLFIPILDIFKIINERLLIYNDILVSRNVYGKIKIYNKEDIKSYTNVFYTGTYNVRWVCIRLYNKKKIFVENRKYGAKLLMIYVNNKNEQIIENSRFDD